MSSQGDKRFIINANWWRKWCDYVNLAEHDQENEAQNRVSNISQYQQSLYEKPQIIVNEGIVDAKKHSVLLKENLIEHFDYESLTEEVWKHLYSWYSADYCIMRLLKRDKVNKKQYYLDLYPVMNAMTEEESEDYELFSESF
mmetsp:Transcript_21511/g.20670  ORF Transcript_21511/g.20670 Transcript_21511/m.20670 type:complete len:142 (-) Transcript_21511:24-449(-)